MEKQDRDGYMNKMNWPEKTLQKGYKIEMCFSYPDEVEENRFMWCCGDFERLNTGDENVIEVDIKWDEQFVACGENDKMEEILKKIVES